MKIGAITYATQQGLGILAKSFYDNGVLTDIMIVEHSSRPTHREWYPNCEHITEASNFRCAIAEDFISGLDILLIFETPFKWKLIESCRQAGVKSVLMPMYECMPKHLPYKPDKYICPSLLDLQYYPDSYESDFEHKNSVFIPVPVDVPWKLRTTAKKFIHNAGHLGLKGRNGTKELLEAMQYVISPIELIVRCQDPKIHKIASAIPSVREDSRITIDEGYFPQEELWSEGDVFIFPEKFNGLSLPLQEACASGMLVMAADRFPMNEWLPNSPLIPVSHYQTSNISPRCLDFEQAIIDPREIANSIDYYYSKNIENYSQLGKLWAEENSWSRLKETYMKELGATL